MNKKLANVIKEEILKKGNSEKLGQSEREALSEIIGFITKSLGEDEDIEKFQVVRDALSQGELQQLQDIWSYTIEDEYVYPVIDKKMFRETIPLLKKVYKIIEDNNLVDENWDAMSAFEKICL